MSSTETEVLDFAMALPWDKKEFISWWEAGEKLNSEGKKLNLEGKKSMSDNGEQFVYL